MSHYTHFPAQCKASDANCQSNAFRVTAARHSDQFAHQQLTPASFQQADLLLACLYDAGQNAERVAMKLDYVATALRRQFISYDSAMNWLSNLDLLDYVFHPAFSYEAVQ